MTMAASMPAPKVQSTTRTKPSKWAAPSNASPSPGNRSASRFARSIGGAAGARRRRGYVAPSAARMAAISSWLNFRSRVPRKSGAREGVRIEGVPVLCNAFSFSFHTRILADRLPRYRNGTGPDERSDRPETGPGERHRPQICLWPAQSGGRTMRGREPRLGEEIEKIRREKGMKQSDLCVNERYCRDIVAGKRIPPEDTLLKLLTDQTEGLGITDVSIVERILKRYGFSALTPEQKNKYLMRLSPRWEGLVAWYPLEGSAADKSGKKNHGVSSGVRFPWEDAIQVGSFDGCSHIL